MVDGRLVLFVPAGWPRIWRDPVWRLGNNVMLSQKHSRYKYTQYNKFHPAPCFAPPERQSLSAWMDIINHGQHQKCNTKVSSTLPLQTDLLPHLEQRAFCPLDLYLYAESRFWARPHYLYLLRAFAPTIRKRERERDWSVGGTPFSSLGVGCIRNFSIAAFHHSTWTRFPSKCVSLSNTHENGESCIRKSSEIVTGKRFLYGHSLCKLLKFKTR